MLLNSVKQVQFRRQNGTLQEAKLLCVNQQQKKHQEWYNKKGSQKAATNQIFKSTEQTTKGR